MENPSPPANLSWWQRGVIYQIWLRSFHDANGDGSGDLEGLIQKLDYLTWLGVDVVWISPIYPSPMVESGYDVSDGRGVHPLFGTLADFDRLVEAVHARGLKLLLDFVPNHTSDAHPWFQASRASRDDPKRAYYLWQDPKDGRAPPNNWLGAFGGSAWSFDKQTRQFYFHSFLPEQPDLNYRNPLVREAVLDAMRFWLRRGVDGFRLDSATHLIKDDELRDNPVNKDHTPEKPPDDVLRPKYTRDRPEVHDVLAEMRAVVDTFSDRMLSGEIHLDAERIVPYYGSKERPELHLPWNRRLAVMPWEARGVGDWIEAYYGALPAHAWPNWGLGSHDEHRVATRAGKAQARVAAMLLLTLCGTPTIYYGDEIGMTDVDIPRDEIRDLREILTPYLGLGRDPQRTPMRWTAAPGAGFTTAAPWQRIGEDVSEVNVEAERNDPRSMLTLHRRLIALRRETPALIEGSYATVRRDDAILVYRREIPGSRVIVALNFTKEQRTVEISGTLRLSTHLDREGDRIAGQLSLRPDEGVIIA